MVYMRDIKEKGICVVCEIHLLSTLLTEKSISYRRPGLRASVQYLIYSQKVRFDY